MEKRNRSDRRDSERRVEDSSVEVNRRFSQRRSGFDRREMLSGQPA